MLEPDDLVERQEAGDENSQVAGALRPELRHEEVLGAVHVAYIVCPIEAPESTHWAFISAFVQLLPELMGRFHFYITIVFF